MKKYLIVLLISIIAFAVNAQSEDRPCLKYEVTANITTDNTNISPDAYMTCHFRFYEGEVFQTINIKKDFTGDGEYTFLSYKDVESDITWSFEIYGHDGDFCFDNDYPLQIIWNPIVYETFVYRCNMQ